MTRRIYIGADRVTVSKPGYDAVSPPAVDYKYLALDSRLATGRPLEIGLIPSFAFNYGATVNFTTSYAGVPAVDIIAYGHNSLGPVYNKSVCMRDAASVAYQRTSFYLGIYPDKFQIVDDHVYVTSAMFGSTYDGLYYIAWQNW